MEPPPVWLAHSAPRTQSESRFPLERRRPRNQAPQIRMVLLLPAKPKAAFRFAVSTILDAVPCRGWPYAHTRSTK